MLASPAHLRYIRPYTLYLGAHGIHPDRAPHASLQITGEGLPYFIPSPPDFVAQFPHHLLYTMTEEAKPSMSAAGDNNDHPRSVKRRLQECAFRILLGTSSLHVLNEMKPSEWSELRERLNDRTQNINVVGALAVATAAVFLTTSAPDGVLLINWNRELPYFCLAACAGCGILAVMSGLGVLVFLDGTDHESIKKALNNTFRFTAIFTLLAMPLTFLSAASFCAGVAWMGAVWFGETLWIKLIVTIGCTVFLFTLFVIGVVLY
ncbi:hypothetical protein EDC04DRAFT_2790964 [Pisolithus marmoratus]|nr:hypothetical protein EDC04DRAFT_2790964 [Pisolithus marmoratus]